MIDAAARILLIKNLYGLKRWGVVKRIDKHFPKLGLTNAVVRLVKVFDRVPLRPMAAL